MTPTDALDMIFMYFFHLIYISSTFILYSLLGGDAKGRLTGIVQLKEIHECGLTFQAK